MRNSPDFWDRVIETDLNACFLLSKFAASMVKHRRGKIINIASMYAVFGAAFAPSYSAAKGAVVQLTKSMAIELAPFNILVHVDGASSQLADRRVDGVTSVTVCKSGMVP